MVRSEFRRFELVCRCPNKTTYLKFEAVEDRRDTIFVARDVPENSHTQCLKRARSPGRKTGWGFAVFPVVFPSQIPPQPLTRRQLLWSLSLCGQVLGCRVCAQILQISISMCRHRKRRRHLQLTVTYTSFCSVPAMCAFPSICEKGSTDVSPSLPISHCTNMCKNKPVPTAYHRPAQQSPRCLKTSSNRCFGPGHPHQSWKISLCPRQSVGVSPGH